MAPLMWLPLQSEDGCGSGDEGRLKEDLLEDEVLLDFWLLEDKNEELFVFWLRLDGEQLLAFSLRLATMTTMCWISG